MFNSSLTLSQQTKLAAYSCLKSCRSVNRYNKIAIEKSWNYCFGALDNGQQNLYYTIKARGNVIAPTEFDCEGFLVLKNQKGIDNAH